MRSRGTISRERQIAERAEEILNDIFSDEDREAQFRAHVAQVLDLDEVHEDLSDYQKLDQERIELLVSRASIALAERELSHEKKLSANERLEEMMRQATIVAPSVNAKSHFTN